MRKNAELKRLLYKELGLIAFIKIGRQRWLGYEDA